MASICRSASATVLSIPVSVFLRPCSLGVLFLPLALLSFPLLLRSLPLPFLPFFLLSLLLLLLLLSFRLLLLPFSFHPCSFCCRCIGRGIAAVLIPKDLLHAAAPQRLQDLGAIGRCDAQPAANG